MSFNCTTVAGKWTVGPFKLRLNTPVRLLLSLQLSVLSPPVIVVQSNVFVTSFCYFDCALPGVKRCMSCDCARSLPVSLCNMIIYSLWQFTQASISCDLSTVPVVQLYWQNPIPCSRSHNCKEIMNISILITYTVGIFARSAGPSVCIYV